MSPEAFEEYKEMRRIEKNIRQADKKDARKGYVKLSDVLALLDGGISIEIALNWKTWYPAAPTPDHLTISRIIDEAKRQITELKT